MRYAARPICDRCWRDFEGNRVPHRLLDDNREPFVEACYVCDRPTRGIVVRARVDS